MACEENIPSNQLLYPLINPGLGLAVELHHSIYKLIIEEYNQRHYLTKDGNYNETTVVNYVTDLFIKHGLKKNNETQEIQGITIYPPEYFCPKSYIDKKIRITPNTVCIHHYDGSWISKRRKFKEFIKRLIGYKKL